MKVAVIGGGPAGILAAAEAAKNGHQVMLFERNRRLGRKLLITGKGRCNLTNIADREEFFANIPRNPKFLYSAWHSLDNTGLMALIENWGTPLKVERGGRVFPVSDRSEDILVALERYLRSSGAKVRLNTRVEDILVQEDRVFGIRVGGADQPFDAVVVATGGVSYPATGSTGDGYEFARRTGHNILAPKPSLVGLETKERWPAQVSGLSLKNVTLRVYRGTKCLYEELGELLFTHTGVSGPLILSASAYLADEPRDARLEIDLKPGLTEQMLDARILRDMEQFAKKQMQNALQKLMPSGLIPIVLRQAQIDPAQVAAQLTKEERKRLGETVKALSLTVLRAGSLAEAVVTRGGVAVKDVRPGTMESKKIRNLFFAGEVLDVDGFTGGFNLQIAFSTGALAGRSIEEEVNWEE